MEDKHKKLVDAISKEILELQDREKTLIHNSKHVHTEMNRIALLERADAFAKVAFELTEILTKL